MKTGAVSDDLPERSSLQDKEWGALYAGLQALLLAHGKEDPYGAGDFWLVDDDWGGQQQKVCVFRIEFITRKVCVQSQRLLTGYSLPWEILFALNIEEQGVGKLEWGVCVQKDSIEVNWNAEDLTRIFGSRFTWTANS